MASTTASFDLNISEQLPTLKTAFDQTSMETVFAPMIRRRFGEKARINSIAIEVLRQRSHRCVIRYCLITVNPETSKEMEWRVIGKVYRPEYGEKVFHDMQQLWDLGFSRNASDGISIPEPLEFSNNLCMLFQEEIPGQPIKTLLKQAPEAEYFRQLARTLIKLHRSPIIPTKPYHVRDHLLRCHPRHGFLALACPELAESIDYITNKAEEIETKLEDVVFTPLHGDFHLGQIHLENGRAWLIDFDALSYGDPAADLGNLLVFLKQKAARNDEIKRVIQTFLDEYFSIMDSNIAKRIALYEALTHLRRACKALRLQENGWEQRVTKMLMMGVASIDEMAKQI